jgi:uncharacterized protein (DUF2141 family)
MWRGRGRRIGRFLLINMLTWLINNRLSWILALGIVVAARAHPLDPFIVCGECQVTGRGVLHVFLVDERSLSAPMSGIQAVTTKLDASGPKTRRVAFAFTVPRGTYGIRCFLDMDGNGGLDRGLFGPMEPWGMSWRVRRPAGFPRFADISFAVAGDVTCPLMIVE